MPAWLMVGSTGHWTIHVQGIRASRAVTLPSMTEAHALGHTSLSVVFHTAGEVEEARRSGLGSSEWEDVADAIDYAYAHGAESITLVGWSMGGAIALETAR